MNLSLLSEGSPEYGGVQYMLEMSINARTPVTVKSLWKISGTPLSNPGIRCWQKLTTGVRDTQDLRRVLNFPEGRPSTFLHGHIDAPVKGCLILWEVQLGTSLLVDDLNVDVPAGFDSVHSESKGKYYLQEYRVRDGISQSRPIFAVVYEQSVQECSRESCKMCRREATVFCPSDNASLCDRCDKDIHRANEIVKEHVRVPITQKAAALGDFGKCTTHTEESVNFYCESCKIQVCVHCKMVGSHSAGEAASHKLKPMKQVYDEALQVMHEGGNDPTMSTHFNDEKVAEIDSLLLKAQDNVHHLETEIRELADLAISQLHRLAKEKTQVLYSTRSSLLHTKQHIEWMDAYMTSRQSTASPAMFLQVWTNHLRIKRQSLASQTQNQQSHPVPKSIPEFRIKGGIEVYSSGGEVRFDTEAPKTLAESRQYECNRGRSISHQPQSRRHCSRDMPSAPKDFDTLSSSTLSLPSYMKATIAPERNWTAPSRRSTSQSRPPMYTNDNVAAPETIRPTVSLFMFARLTRLLAGIVPKFGC